MTTKSGPLSRILRKLNPKTKAWRKGGRHFELPLRGNQSGTLDRWFVIREADLIQHWTGVRFCSGDFISFLIEYWDYHSHRHELAFFDWLKGRNCHEFKYEQKGRDRLHLPNDSDLKTLESSPFPWPLKVSIKTCHTSSLQDGCPNCEEWKSESRNLEIFTSERQNRQLEETIRREVQALKNQRGNNKKNSWSAKREDPRLELKRRKVVVFDDDGIERPVILTDRALEFVMLLVDWPPSENGGLVPCNHTFGSRGATAKDGKRALTTDFGRVKAEHLLAEIVRTRKGRNKGYELNPSLRGLPPRGEVALQFRGKLEPPNPSRE